MAPRKTPSRARRAKPGSAAAKRESLLAKKTSQQAKPNQEPDEISDSSIESSSTSSSSSFYQSSHGTESELNESSGSSDNDNLSPIESDASNDEDGDGDEDEDEAVVVAAGRAVIPRVPIRSRQEKVSTQWHHYNKGKNAWSKENPKPPASRDRAQRPIRKNVFLFYNLPAELRNVIYSHLLLIDAGISLHKTKVSRVPIVRRTIDNSAQQKELHSETDDSTSPTPQPLTWSLLLLCKNSYREAGSVLYTNRFYLPDSATLHLFLTQIGPQSRCWLQDIVLQKWGYNVDDRPFNFCAFSLLATATNLKRLYLDCRIGHSIYFSTNSGKAVARRLFREGCYFLRGIGYARGRADAAIEIVEVADKNFEVTGGSTVVGDYSHAAPQSEAFKLRANEEREQFKAELRRRLLRA